jgi:hypothetical protein
VIRFCADTCWGKRGRIFGSEAGAGCPHYNRDKMCLAGHGEPHPCSFSSKVGPNYKHCHVYRLHPL